MFTQPGFALRLKDGNYLAHVFPHKSGSTVWNQLRTKAATGNYYVDPFHLNFAELLKRVRGLTMVPLGSVLCDKSLIQICLVRNPFERMLSVYEDKIRSELNLLPVGLTNQSTLCRLCARSRSREGTT